MLAGECEGLVLEKIQIRIHKDKQNEGSSGRIQRPNDSGRIAMVVDGDDNIRQGYYYFWRLVVEVHNGKQVHNDACHGEFMLFGVVELMYCGLVHSS